MKKNYKAIRISPKKCFEVGKEEQWGEWW